mgnify:FL=1
MYKDLWWWNMCRPYLSPTRVSVGPLMYAMLRGEVSVKDDYPHLSQCKGLCARILCLAVKDGRLFGIICWACVMDINGNFRSECLRCVMMPLTVF